MLEEILNKIDKKKDQLEDIKPIDLKFQRKLDDKYRLEWNFHSNHIEGNTLTYGETQILLFKERATGDHDIREYEEMQAHDLAIDLIKEWAKDDARDMSESDLRELNKIILVKPFWAPAVTEDGQPTRKKIEPGKYKTTPNSVQLKSGRIHYYPAPEETPILINELFEWYNQSLDLHPLLRAAYTHHKLTQIHPFDDGNGRVARLWLNYILLKSNYPPLIIRTGNKEKYLTALEKADAGDIEPFVNYLAEELEWSLTLSLRAAKGLNLEEPDDLEKRIAILDKRIRNKKQDEQSLIKQSSELIFRLINGSLFKLMDKINEDLNKVKGWFTEGRIMMVIDGNNYASTRDFELAQALDDIVFKFHNPRIEIDLEGFKNLEYETFNVFAAINISFEQWNYKLLLNNDASDILLKKTYNSYITENEMSNISKKVLNHIVKEIEEEVENRNP